MTGLSRLAAGGAVMCAGLPCALASGPLHERSFEDPSASELRTFGDAGDSDRELANIGRVRPPLLATSRFGPPFDHFDGFETYAAQTDLTQDPADWVEIDEQIAPNGAQVDASFFFAAVDWTNADIQPPIAAPPPDPFGGAGVPGDPDPSVDQVLLDGQGYFGQAIDNGLFVGVRLSHGLFAPTTSAPLIMSADFHLQSLESLVRWSPSSRRDGRVVTRILMGGFKPDDPFANADGFADRYATLWSNQICGLSPGVFFATPMTPAAGLDGLVVKSGEWFSVAVWRALGEFRVFVRDSQTDGSNGVLIDDPDDIPGFESGWCEIFPGKPATELAPGVWTSYGEARDEFGQFPNLFCNLAGTADNMFTAIGDNNQSVVRDNSFMDNYSVIGTEFCRADLDLDGDVGAQDLAILLGAWGQTGPNVDTNGPVNAQDLALLLGQWGPCIP